MHLLTAPTSSRTLEFEPSHSWSLHIDIPQPATLNYKQLRLFLGVAGLLWPLLGSHKRRSRTFGLIFEPYDFLWPDAPAYGPNLFQNARILAFALLVIGYRHP